MLIRIVKLTFKPENIPSFQRIFETTKPGILAFEGCTLVELYQDIKNPNVFFTYSFWDKESDLENYRASDFFKDVWSNTKTLFMDKPEAWSVTKSQSSNPS
ncbi:antibiotic biosynthesis monooxygenase [Flagellimonas hymeniacidonis]|uniref:Antibiotic biosynthesis monooxygenase n=1 Tax=Flagellimonas hymeniacidonis TaxID=2603628 RepID=A0A5C8V626_9FLAO|nr:antibiotic biosynthesis monooxygenase family protein [Flagellimonas hymeniacidonis]TXN35947.1 antibiotic biosynthesis monooxygenase [Flagellimonas hymeniacidonis]